MKVTWILGLMAISLVACEESAPTAPASSAKPQAAASAKPATTAAPTAAANNDELPTIEDFEESANSQITAANLEKELDALEKEINAAE